MPSGALPRVIAANIANTSIVLPAPPSPRTMFRLFNRKYGSQRNFGGMAFTSSNDTSPLDVSA